MEFPGPSLDPIGGLCLHTSAEFWTPCLQIPIAQYDEKSLNYVEGSEKEEMSMILQTEFATVVSG